MSTRCTVTVRNTEDGNEQYTIYRHFDGYPDTEAGVIADLAKALAYAWPLPRFEADDFAAAIIAAWKTPGAMHHGYVTQGGNIRFSLGRDEHPDTAWHYEVFPRGGKVIIRSFEATWPDGYDAPTVWVMRKRECRLTAKQCATLRQD